jgi:hypothetical protein
LLVHQIIGQDANEGKFEFSRACNLNEGPDVLVFVRTNYVKPVGQQLVVIYQMHHHQMTTSTTMTIF